MIGKLFVALVLSSFASVPVDAQIDSLSSPQVADAVNLASRFRNVQLMNASGALAVRDSGALQTKDWTSDLRLQVVNVSTRPIYYASVSVIFPDLIWEETGRAYGVRIYYGDSRLVDLRSIAGATDKPVMPGDTFTLNATEPVAVGLKHFIKNRKVSPEAVRRVELVWQEVSFGDRTGFQAGNLPYPVADAAIMVLCQPPCTKSGIDPYWYCDYPYCQEDYPNFDPHGNCMNWSYSDYDCCGINGCRPCSIYTFWSC